MEVFVSSLPGLVILKLIAWDEKYPERNTDAKDIYRILKEYDQAGNMDRLYEQMPELLSEEGYDTTNAGIRLLGRDMIEIGEQTLRTILSILQNENKQNKLALDMVDIRDLDGRNVSIALLKWFGNCYRD